MTNAGSLFRSSMEGAKPLTAGPDNLLPHHYRGAGSINLLMSRDPGFPGTSYGSSNQQSTPPVNINSVFGRATGSLRNSQSSQLLHLQAQQVSAHSLPKMSKMDSMRNSASLGNLGNMGEPGRIKHPPGPRRLPSSHSGAVVFAGSSPQGSLTGRTSMAGSPPSGTGSPMFRHQASMPVSYRSHSHHHAEIDENEISVLASRLSGSFGTPGFFTRVSSASNLMQAMANKNGGMPLSALDDGMLQRYPSFSLPRSESNSSLVNASMGTTAIAFPICLICLEILTPDDFNGGKAITLECKCRGDMALRHYECAIEWNNAKGNTICDICKHEILNLPPVDPAILEAREEARRRRMPNFDVSGQHTFADYCFDFIRVSWIVMVVAVLFLDLALQHALFIGACSGVGYVLLVLTINACISFCRRLPPAPPTGGQHQPLLSNIV
eukprot:gene16062-22199_t